MNIAKLNRVKRFISREIAPSQFAMESYFTSDPNLDDQLNGLLRDLPRKKIAKCGTACCIAGATIALEFCGGMPRKAYERVKGYGAKYPREEAQEILGLSPSESARLFFTSNWPVKLYEEFKAAKTLKGRVKVACKRIDHFIKTDGAE